MNWREVLDRYHNACIEDARRDNPETSRGQFIHKFGTSALKDREQECQHRCRQQVMSLEIPSPEDYDVIEEGPERVIVQVDGAELTDIAFPTRYVLVLDDSDWRLDDVMWKCTCEDGQCFACNGSGTCTICNGNARRRKFFGLLNQTCLLCKGDPQCKYCDGSGRCDRCLKSVMPGWNSR